MIDKQHNWNDHINILENKLSKGLGLLHKADEFLNRKAIASPYYSLFHSYLTYRNIAWYSTIVSKLKGFASKQRQVIKSILVTKANVES